LHPLLPEVAILLKAAVWSPGSQLSTWDTSEDAQARINLGVFLVLAFFFHDNELCFAKWWAVRM